GCSPAAARTPARRAPAPGAPRSDAARPTTSRPPSPDPDPYATQRRVGPPPWEQCSWAAAAAPAPPGPAQHASPDAGSLARAAPDSTARPCPRGRPDTHTTPTP